MESTTRHNRRRRKRSLGEKIQSSSLDSSHDVNSGREQLHFQLQRRLQERYNTTVAVGQLGENDDIRQGNDVTPPAVFSKMDPLDRSKKGAVLVTGGAGFIGSHVAEYLLKRGDEVAIVDEINDYYDVRLKQRNLSNLKRKWGERVRLYVGDICDEAFISQVWQLEQPTRIVHLAARAGVRPSIQNPYIYIHSNIEGTTRLLELARQQEGRVESFVFASSSSVYGGSTNDFFKETDTIDLPVSQYAASKKSCELLAFTYHHLYKLNISGLRFFTVYGPWGRPDMAPFKFIDHVSRGMAISQFGDGTTQRDYTYIDDIVDGVVAALDTPMGYQIYNLGRGEPVSLSKFIDSVEQAVGTKAQINQLPMQPGDVPRTCADISKAGRLLKYQPKVPFEEGIKKTVKWYQDEYMAISSNTSLSSEADLENAVKEFAVVYRPFHDYAMGWGAYPVEYRSGYLSRVKVSWPGRRSSGDTLSGSIGVNNFVQQQGLMAVVLCICVVGTIITRSRKLRGLLSSSGSNRSVLRATGVPGRVPATASAAATITQIKQDGTAAVV